MEYYGDNDYRSYLSHHGIKGMKWGVRRFQNSDGTLTAAGKKRNGQEKKSGFAPMRKLAEHQRRKQEKTTARYKEKYKLTDKQADSVYKYGKERKYSKSHTERIAKNIKKSHGNVDIANMRAIGQEFLIRTAITATAVAVLSTPQGRRAVAKGAVATARAINSVAKTAAKGARAAKGAASAAKQKVKDTYWHFNPKNAPKQSVVDAKWREVPVSNVPAVYRPSSGGVRKRSSSVPRLESGDRGPLRTLDDINRYFRS